MRLAGEIILVWLILSVTFALGWVMGHAARPRVTNVQPRVWSIDTREPPKPPPTPRPTDPGRP